jgi:TolA-binding protein
MNERQVDQLDKVLALVESSHEGEAIGAVRMARQLLSRDGLSFGDLARAASTHRSRFSFARTLFSGQAVHLEAQIAQLQQIINDLRKDSQSLNTQVEFWRRRAFEMEQQQNLSQSDAQRWKQLARETAEKLWDISHIASMPEWQEDAADDSDSSPAAEKAKRG